LLGDPSILGTKEKFDDFGHSNKKKSFNEAIEALRLPKVEAKEKGK
jgi:hypothetical protein